MVRSTYIDPFDYKIGGGENGGKGYFDNIGVELVSSMLDVFVPAAHAGGLESALRGAAVADDINDLHDIDENCDNDVFWRAVAIMLVFAMVEPVLALIVANPFGGVIALIVMFFVVDHLIDVMRKNRGC